VATELSRDVMRRLARLGAERRLEELRQEEASIRAAFPELGAATTRKRRGRRAGRGAAGSAATPASGTNQGRVTKRRRPRRKMSAAEKKAVSERMRKYWAARRKAEG
jgi:hypothetical protein